MLRRSLVYMLLTLFLPVLAARGDEVVMNNGDRVSGVVTKVADGKITIEQTKFGTITAALSDVQSFTAKQSALTTSQPAIAAAPANPAPPPQPPPATPVKAATVKRWSGAVTATALATRGNSDTESVRVSVDALRKGDNNTLTLAAGYAFGQTEDQNTGDTTTNIDNWFATAKVDHSLGEKLYDYALVRVERDNVANLDLRISPGAGLGYRWINKPEQHFNTEIGVNYVWEDFATDGTNEHVAVRLAYHWDKKLNDKVSLVHNLEYLPSVERIDDFNLNVDAGIRSTLTDKLFAEFKVEWRHDASPAPGADRNDLRYTLGVGFKW